MSIDLSPEAAQYIEQQVATGQFKSSREVVDAALAALRARQSKLEELQESVRVGWEEADRGEFVTGFSAESLQAKGREYLATKKQAQSRA